MAEKVPVQTWSREAYQWAIDSRVYLLSDDVPNIDAIRETVDDQREMVFLWRSWDHLGNGGGGGVPVSEFNAHQHDEGKTGKPIKQL